MYQGSHFPWGSGFGKRRSRLCSPPARRSTGGFQCPGAPQLAGLNHVSCTYFCFVLSCITSAASKLSRLAERQCLPCRFKSIELSTLPRLKFLSVFWGVLGVGLVWGQAWDDTVQAAAVFLRGSQGAECSGPVLAYPGWYGWWCAVWVSVLGWECSKGSGFGRVQHSSGLNSSVAKFI